LEPNPGIWSEQPAQNNRLPVVNNNINTALVKYNTHVELGE